MENNRQLLIGQLAKEAGVKSDTVRFYEKEGLLMEPTRTPSGYRLYDNAALNQIRFIKKAQTLGFSLPEIKSILNLRGQGSTTCRCVLAMAEATLRETETKLRELQQFRNALKRNVKHWRATTQSGGQIAADFCALIESSILVPLSQVTVPSEVDGQQRSTQKRRNAAKHR